MMTNSVGTAVKRRGTAARLDPAGEGPWLDPVGMTARSGCTRMVARGALVGGQKKQIEEEEWHP